MTEYIEPSSFICRCLTFGVRILPYELKRIILASEKYKVPDEILDKFNSEQINKYVKALSLCTREESRYWDEGHQYLKELGFKERTRREGHREFITLIFKQDDI